ncbi:MAG: hypothetical protein KGI49_00980 [Patescibacteria group bacterium]|nr:hypothetical protein [Patescibacteria group bacterium]
MTANKGVAKSAEAFMRLAGAHGDRMSFSDALNQVNQTNLLEQENIQRVQIESIGKNAGAINVASVHVGGSGKKQQSNQQQKTN